jgi:hypothetical protein
MSFINQQALPSLVTRHSRHSPLATLPLGLNMEDLRSSTITHSMIFFPKTNCVTQAKIPLAFSSGLVDNGVLLA